MDIPKNNNSMYSLLYVDDELSLLELGKIFLERGGLFTVTIADSVDKGIEHLASQCFDAIISDYDMPKKNGIIFLKEVRERFGDIPFILFTGRGREDVVIDAINNRADFYLQKGSDVLSQYAELSHKVVQAIRRKKAEDDLFSSRQMLQLILDTIPLAVFWKDKNSVYLGSNKPFAFDTGYASPEDLVVKPIMIRHLVV